MATPKTAIRSAITAIIGFMPGKGGTELRTTKEVVPFREEIFQDSKFGLAVLGVADALHKVQRHVAEATQAARSLPVLGGSYWPGLVLSNTPMVIAHGIAGGVAVSFLVVSIRSPSGTGAMCVVETAQDPTNGRVSVAVQPPGSSLTADLWIFPRPSVA